MLSVLLTVAAAAGAESTTVTVSNVTYRVQCLSPTLVRLEQQGPNAQFEDRPTFFARNRTVGGSGVPIASTTKRGNATILHTRYYDVELSPAAARQQLRVARHNTGRGQHAESGSACCDPAPSTSAVGAVLLPNSAAAARAGSVASCCAACDAAAGCTAWSFVPSVTSKGGALRFAKCDPQLAGQQWTFTAAGGAITAVHSAQKDKNDPGCWQVPNCATKAGEPVVAGKGCKAVPTSTKGYPCAANEAFSFHASNKSITSAMNGLCVTAANEKLQLSPCKPSTAPCKASNGCQRWAWDESSGAISLDGGAAGMCLDDSQPPSVVPANCTLIASMSSVKAGGAGTLGGLHPANAFKSGSGCAVTLRSPGGDVLWSSPSFGGVSAELVGPPPSEVQPSSVLAIRDSPRFVPPARGATPPSLGDADPPSLANVSGYDIYNHATDVYLFLATGGYKAMRKEFVTVTGPTPVLPPWAFGLWFCWYHPYNQTEKTAEIQRFLDDGLGLSVVSLDRDWRQEAYTPEMNASRGEFPYVVNATLFPTMDKFFSWVHAKPQSLRVFFNDHPKPLFSGMGGAGSSAADVVLSPAEIAFRYDGLTSIMKRGLDFWWYDCHWKWFEPSLKIPNANEAVDGVTWGQSAVQDIMVKYDKETRPTPTSSDVKPFSLGCSGSDHPASHRYPVWWTGDNFSTKLMTAVASMIEGGYRGFKPYVHPDCTAHHNPDPPEIYVRWIQFCSMGTIMRVHSDPYNDRRPWKQNSTGQGPSIEAIFKKFVQLRVKIGPSLASAAVQVAEDGSPLVKRCDFAWPKLPEATRMDQFLLDDSSLVAPVNPFFSNCSGNCPAKPVTYNRTRDVWVPPGEWTDAFDGSTVTGPKTITRKGVALDEMPLYHKRGALVVTSDRATSIQGIDWRSGLVLQCWPNSAEHRAVRFSRNFFDNSLPGYVFRTELALEQEQATQHTSERIVRVVIGAERVHSGTGLVPQRAVRRMLLRLHLLPGESVASTTVQGEHVEHSMVRPTTKAQPFGGKGAAVGQHAGITAELVVTGGGRRIVQVVVVAGAAQRKLKSDDGEGNVARRRLQLRDASLFGLSLVHNSPAQPGMVSLSPKTGNVSTIGPPLHVEAGTSDLRVVDSKAGLFWYFGDSSSGATLVATSLGNGSIVCRTTVPGISEVGFVGIGQTLHLDTVNDRLVVSGLEKNASGGFHHVVTCDGACQAACTPSAFMPAGDFAYGAIMPMLHGSAFDSLGQTLYTTIDFANKTSALGIFDLKAQTLTTKNPGRAPLVGMAWDVKTKRLVGCEQDTPGPAFGLISIDPSTDPPAVTERACAGSQGGDWALAGNSGQVQAYDYAEQKLYVLASHRPQPGKQPATGIATIDWATGALEGTSCGDKNTPALPVCAPALAFPPLPTGSPNPYKAMIMMDVAVAS